MGSGAREAATNEVLDSLPDPVIGVDGSGRVVFVNRAALLAMERNAEEASAKCAEFLSAAASSFPGKGGQDAFEAPLPMKDGSTRFFEFKPMRLGNNAVFIGRDSDERKRLLDELTSAREQEAEASAKLRRTISDLEEFALLAIRRELKMQELRERFVRLKEEHEINKEFPG
jgi:PAS domain-containing protein